MKLAVAISIRRKAPDQEAQFCKCSGSCFSTPPLSGKQMLLASSKFTPKNSDPISNDTPRFWQKREHWSAIMLLLTLEAGGSSKAFCLPHLVSSMGAISWIIYPECQEGLRYAHSQKQLHVVAACRQNFTQRKTSRCWIEDFAMNCDQLLLAHLHLLVTSKKLVRNWDIKPAKIWEKGVKKNFPWAQKNRLCFSGPKLRPLGYRVCPSGKCVHPRCLRRQLSSSHRSPASPADHMTVSMTALFVPVMRLASLVLWRTLRFPLGGVCHRTCTSWNSWGMLIASRSGIRTRHGHGMDSSKLSRVKTFNLVLPHTNFTQIADSEPMNPAFNHFWIKAGCFLGGRLEDQSFLQSVGYFHSHVVCHRQCTQDSPRLNCCSSASKRSAPPFSSTIWSASFIFESDNFPAWPAQAEGVPRHHVPDDHSTFFLFDAFEYAYFSSPNSTQP